MNMREIFKQQVGLFKDNLTICETGPTQRSKPRAACQRVQSTFLRCLLFPSRLGMFLAIIVCLTGCGSLPKPRPEWSERRPVDTQVTTWAQTVATQAAEHPGYSGVELVRYGLDALSARLALIDTAERTLDLQYYVWLPDAAGRLLAERVLRAADRGVRVRILLDDIGGTASDKVLLALDAHTNVEVRIFNPIANRTFRKLSSILDLQRVNRRMHNKSFTADASVTILGGRNIAENYFAVGEETRYVDYEVIATGPVVKDVFTMFERFWYSPSSIPIQALIPKHISPAQLAEMRAALAAKVQVTTNLPGFKVVRASEIGAAVRRHDLPLEWGSVRLLRDLPEKVTTDPDDPSTHLLPALRAAVNETTNVLAVVSPYFVPGKQGTAFLLSLRRRGVRVVVLSNSLAANDVTAVHAGYRRYRKPLLRAGVEMWEMKPDVEIRVAEGHHAAAPQSKGEEPKSTLHAKSLIFDRQTLFVGSFNLDPRSASLNTEMGLIIHIPKLARTTAQALEEQLPQNAYRLKLVPDSGPCKESGHIVWLSQENGREVRYTHEPHATFSQRLKVWVLSFLPIESQL
jgi:cardiolipin synthase C